MNFIMENLKAHINHKTSTNIENTMTSSHKQNDKSNNNNKKNYKLVVVVRVVSK